MYRSKYSVKKTSDTFYIPVLFNNFCLKLSIFNILQKLYRLVKPVLDKSFTLICGCKTLIIVNCNKKKKKSIKLV